MTPKQAREILSRLFTQHPDALVSAIHDISRGIRARDVASRHIIPILTDIESAAGQEMDSTYIVYLIEYAHDATPTTP
jgi:hypothetical protein